MATNIKMKVFILLFLVANVECLHLQLFEYHDYDGFIREFKLSSTEEKTCFTVKDSLSNPNGMRPIHELAMSIRTDKCVILYQFDDCRHSADIWRLDKDTPSYPADVNDTIIGAHFKIGSFHVCSQELGGGPLLDVDFYPDNLFNEKILLKYRNVCGCQNITLTFTTDESHARSVDNYGNGLAVFEKEHCKPPYVYIPPGKRSIFDSSNHLAQTNSIFIRMHSFYPMGTVDCARLDASVFKFDFKNASSHDDLELEDVFTSLESVFINNGTGEMSQEYTASQRVKEVMEMTRAKGFSNVKTIGVDVTMENELKFGLPLISNDKIKLKITGKYQWQETASGTDTEKKSVENEETFSIKQSIKIPPCMEYHVSSYVKMVKNYTLEYTAFARLTGKVGEDKMGKNDLKLHIGPGMEYVRDFDDYTIEVSVKGQMFAKYGIKSFISGQGVNIPNCLKTLNAYNIQPILSSHFVYELPIRGE